MLCDFPHVASRPVAPLSDLRQHGLGVLDAGHVVHTHGPPHGRLTQVLVLVLAQPGDGLQDKTRA